MSRSGPRRSRDHRCAPCPTSSRCWPRGREDVGDLALLEIVLDRLGGRRPQVAHHDEDVVALDQALGVGDRLGGLVDVVVGDQLDLAAVDAAGLVDAVEDRLHAGLDVDAPVGDGAGEIQAGADHDLLVGDALLCAHRAAPTSRRTPMSTLSTADGREALHGERSFPLGHRCPRYERAHAVVAQQLLAVAGQRDRPRLEHVAVIRDRQGLVGVLLHEQHRGAALVDGPDDGEDLLDEHGRQPQRRLVEQHQDWLGHEAPADGQHLLLAAAQRPGQLRPPLGQDRKARVHALERRLDGALVRARVGAHLEVLQHAQLREELAALGDVRDPAPGDRLARQPVDPLSAEAHGPLGRRDQPGDALQRGGLPRPVGPQQRDNRALGHLERHAPERLDGAVERLDTVENQERLSRVTHRRHRRSPRDRP